MTQIGIGELKHAKPELVKKAGAMIRAHQQIVQKRESEAQKEGQLAVDILHSEDQMIVICPIAGVEKGDIQVAVSDDVLTIRGERRRIPNMESKTTLVNELYWGTFSRSIVLPDSIDRKNIQARVHEHMLIVSIPKTEDFKTRIIHIKEEA